MSSMSSIPELSWSRKFQIGHEKIDGSHAVFLGLIKSVVSNYENNLDREAICRSLIELRKFADYHFYGEESVMLHVGYTDYEQHKSMHSKLLGNLDKWIFGYQSNAVEALFIVGQLHRWFFLHTNNEDIKIQSFINAKSK